MLVDESTEKLTCLAESDGHTLVWNDRAIAYRLYRDGGTDTLYFCLDFAAETEDALATNHFRVVYNGETKGFAAVAGFSSPTCVLTYAEAVRSLSLRLAAEDDTLTLDGTERREIACPFAWCDGLPQLTWSAHFYAAYNNYVTWKITPPEGKYATPRKAVLYVKRQGEDAFAARTSANLDFDLRGWYIATDEADLGALYYFRVVYTMHESKNGAWVTKNTLTTPVATIDRDGRYPLPPVLTHGAILRGGKVRLRWDNADDPLYTFLYFDLYRAVAEDKSASPTWTLLYSGKGKQFTDTPPESGYVRYKVRGRTANSAREAVTDTGWCAQAKSNLFVGVGGKAVPAAAVYIGGKTALALAFVGKE